MQRNNISSTLIRFLIKQRSPHAVVIFCILWVVLIANGELWRHLFDRFDSINPSSIGYVLSLICLMVTLLAIPLLILCQRYVLKPLLLFILILSATLAYFTQKLGVIFDLEMMRNIMETVKDRNMQEANELMSYQLVGYVMLTMSIPICIVLFSNIQYGKLIQEQVKRIAACVVIVSIAATLVMLNFKYITYFSRENNDLEIYLTPFYTLQTTVKLIKRLKTSNQASFTVLGQDAVQIKRSANRTVAVLVVGETARRDHFELNGYKRRTNPLLTSKNVFNFNNATSCGTSTAYSVPCMFSMMRQTEYSPEKAPHQSNVLDILETAGVKTLWIDNNSSCKGVCTRIENINLTENPDKNNPLYVEGAFLDEVLLDYVSTSLDSNDQDMLLVLHTMGSHGPAYYRRYSESFAKFYPYCKSKSPQSCPQEEIINAYDNTILYTDEILASIIELLENRGDSSFMLYASDHGESLGENGVYLHGLPRFLAPASQTQIPFIAWFSDRYLSDSTLITNSPDITQIDKPVTHDNISATLLGLYDVRTSEYDQKLDLFSKAP